MGLHWSMMRAEGSVVGYTITVKGLKGGHSGMDIHKGLVMPIMNRLLFDGFDNFGLQISK
jgi:dipeptidase D